uniref:Secreted protein n=1 Tax=Ixodes ricinus TaxID=34613 RepID=V5IBQ5_IXORI
MIKIMFLAIFAALLTLHVFRRRWDCRKPEHAYDCYWKFANASDRVCRNHEQDGFFFFNFHSCSARCKSGFVERRLPPGITCRGKWFREAPARWSRNDVGKIGPNDDPLICFG